MRLEASAAAGKRSLDTSPYVGTGVSLQPERQEIETATAT